jgi:hypothetical protein
MVFSFLMQDGIFGINMYYRWLNTVCLILGDSTISDDNHYVTLGDQSGCCSIEAHFSGASLTLDSIGLEPMPIVDIQYVNHLIGEDIGCLHEFLVQSDTSLIVKVHSCDPCPMNLAL